MPLCRIRGTSFSYLWLGASVGPDRCPVVLVHGLGASLAFWYPMIAAALARTHRVLLFDLRGHGRSGMTPSGYAPLDLAADLAALLATLDVGAAHLVGHSFGGSVALGYALKHPHLVKTLTIADARIRALQPHVTPGNWATDRDYRETLARHGMELDVRQAAFGVEWLTKMAQARLHHPERMNRLSRMLPSPFMGVAGKTAAARWLELVSATTLTTDITEPETAAVDEIAGCDFPVLLAYGEYSHARGSAAAFRQACRTARLEIVRGAGHFFPFTRPDALLVPLLQLLDERPAARSGGEEPVLITDA